MVRPISVSSVTVGVNSDQVLFSLSFIALVIVHITVVQLVGHR